ncbi:L7Ae/L30e/S12e/Gadd45 family ribosomal protein [Desulfotomaculum nigrificans]|uniref:L7Ae/L30e/S12e/Gadd45 family ribosomal protein n=1 Tax=Desulfotomaculum nigrificans TaxID=1565 RepID=UPI0001FAF0BE|nr:ribosomal L7Ae/L30e/S12e/Gadd45 family protein [Desulfotomaculum nigrificans]
MSGDFAVRANITKAKLMIIAKDASERIKQEYLRIGKSNKVPTIVALSKEELGSALGKSPRAAVAILDNNFAQGVGRLLERGEV